MNIRLKRTTRTPYSEEVAILDTETRDENDEPVTIGKMDVHYADDQIVGTLLIWQEYATGYASAHPGTQGMDELIDAILAEISEPVGVSGTYAVEVFYPTASSQGFFSNYPDDDMEEEQQAEESLAAAGTPPPNWEGEPASGDENEDESEEGPGDNFLESLRRRPQ